MKILFMFDFFSSESNETRQTVAKLRFMMSNINRCSQMIQFFDTTAVSSDNFYPWLSTTVHHRASLDSKGRNLSTANNFC